MLEFERLRNEFGWRIEHRARSSQGVWEIEAAHARKVFFPKDGHEECFQLEDGSYWFEHRNKMIHRFLHRYLGHGGCLWDIGAGNGAVAAYLSKRGYRVVAVEPVKSGALYCAQAGVQEVICGFFEDLGLPDASIAAAGCFDILEHLENPSSLLRSIHGALQNSGLLAVTVPAFRMLWSDSDEQAGHFQRYTKRGLMQLLETNGFRTLRLSYMMATLFPAVWLRRSLPSLLGMKLSGEAIASQLSPRRDLLRTKIIIGALAIEYRAHRYLNLPFGSSIIGIFQKR